MIIKDDIWFSPAKQNRRLHIYLPDSYTYEDEHYPVMYMFDGHNLFFDADATYGTSWGFKEFLDSWDKKIIVVGVECAHEGHSRLSEYSPYDFSTDWAGHIRGTGDMTMRWIIEELKPFIDENFRTWKHREATGIGGSSMGGLMSLYAVVAYNHIFSKSACVSSSLPFCNPQMRSLIENSSLFEDTKVFLSWGGKEGHSLRGKAIMKSCHLAINKRLYEKKAQPYLFYQKNGGHCEADWRLQVSFFMNWLWCNRF